MKIRAVLLTVIILTIGFFVFSDKTVYSHDYDAGSDITITDIAVADFGENDGSNIDVFRNTDCSGDGDVTKTDIEDFSDTTATITISNASRPNFPESTSYPVRIYKYAVSFKKIGSSVKNKNKMPDLKGFSRNISFTVPAATKVDEPVIKDLKITIISKAMKEAFASQYIFRFGEDPRNGIDPIRYLDYKVKIKIYGKEVPFNNRVSDSSGTSIILTEVNNCATNP